MASVDEVMRSYIVLCINDWKIVPDGVRRTIGRCIPTGVIAENQYEAIQSISSTYNADDHSRLRFIPMPTNRVNTGCFFFLPILHVLQNGDRVRSFELLQIRTNKHCIAFRFDTAATHGRHGYSHVQLCRKLQRKNIEVKCLPDWVHISYPAFPSPGHDPLGMFLTMATAVHGLDNGGFRSLLQEIFHNRISQARTYIQELHTVLGV